MYRNFQSATRVPITRVAPVMLAIFVLCSFVSNDLAVAQGTQQEVVSNQKLPAEMQRIYEAFKTLQPYLYRRDAFFAPQNEQSIGELLKTLGDGFHRARDTSGVLAAEPGFVSTLRVVSEMLNDASKRFAEGKKGYALWRLKTTSNYCVSCHARFEVPVKFHDDSAEMSELSEFERADFYLATRQFERARDLFLKIVYDPAPRRERMEALRKWLVISTRIVPDAKSALRELTRIRSRVHLQTAEDIEVQGWLESLRRWDADGPLSIDPVVKAENLIRQGLGMNDPISGRRGTIELLRATRILHGVLDDGALDEKGTHNVARRTRILYLLGLAYNSLPFFFVNELPEMFLEQCIREAPNSQDARRAYQLYSEIVMLGFTGSGGVQVPDDVETSLRKLHDLAYGVAILKGQG